MFRLIQKKRQEKRGPLRNFYPSYPLRISLIPIAWHTIKAAGIVSGYFQPDTAYPQSGFIPLEDDSQGVFYHLFQVAIWIISDLLLFLYALPGEVIGWFTSKKGAGEQVGIIFILAKIWEEFKTLLFIPSGGKLAKAGK